MSCPKGEWNNIVRTDYFFMAFSSGNDETDLNCMRSSNGGFSNINFAELSEVISQENVNKAVNPSVLRDYLLYKTGKNKGQYPLYDEDKYIDCTSDKAHQIKWYVLDKENITVSYNEIENSGKYLILKDLQDKPQDEETFYILEVESMEKTEGVVINHKLYNSEGFKYYSRSKENGVWSEWKLIYVTQKEKQCYGVLGFHVAYQYNSTWSLMTFLQTSDGVKYVIRYGCSLVLNALALGRFPS